MATDDEFINAIFIYDSRDDAVSDAFAARDDSDGTANQRLGHVVADGFKLAVMSG